MMTYRSGGLRIAQLWFDEPSEGVAADIIRYRQALVPPPGARATPFVTRVIDLARSEEEIFADIHHETRSEINRARARDGLVCRTWDGRDPAPLERFRATYDAFASQKGLTPLPWREVRQWEEAGMLDLSWASRPDGEELVFHSYVVVAGRARGAYAASLFRLSGEQQFRNLVGRANRFLHWYDITRYKARGLRTYDLGGWYDGTTDVERLRINEFKRRFGGRLETNYDTEQAVTLRARLALRLRPLVARFRRSPAG